MMQTWIQFTFSNKPNATYTRTDEAITNKNKKLQESREMKTDEVIMAFKSTKHYILQ